MEMNIQSPEQLFDFIYNLRNENQLHALAALSEMSQKIEGAKQMHQVFSGKSREEIEAFSVKASEEATKRNGRSAKEAFLSLWNKAEEAPLSNDDAKHHIALGLLKELMKNHMPKADFDAAMAVSEEDKEGTLSFPEFLAQIRAKGGNVTDEELEEAKQMDANHKAIFN